MTLHNRIDPRIKQTIFVTGFIQSLVETQSIFLHVGEYKSRAHIREIQTLS